MMRPDGTFQEDIVCIVPPKANKGAIYVSNLQAACNPVTLKNHNIGAVITAIKGKNLSETIPRYIEYLYIPVVDHESCDISIYFKDSYQFIDQQRKRTNVLVHCMAGVSRSVTLIIAYLMEKSSISFQTAYQYVKNKRSIIHPNDTFIKNLKELEVQLQRKNKSFLEQNFKESNSLPKKLIKQTKEPKLPQQIKKALASTADTFYPLKAKQNGSDQNNSKVSSPKTKQNKIRPNNQNYDQILRKNIKKLFSMTSSQTFSRIRQDRAY